MLAYHAWPQWLWLPIHPQLELDERMSVEIERHIVVLRSDPCAAIFCYFYIGPALRPDQ